MARSVEIATLRPTQITLGMAFVRANRIKFAEMKQKKRKKMIADRKVPVVKGPNGTLWMTDRHHFCRALAELGETQVRAKVEIDAGRLPPDEFALFMEKSALIHPYDGTGARKDIASLPATITDLVDDPYRTLAGLVRERGGYKKEKRPFAEFLWADFFRSRVPLDLLTDDLAEALEMAVALADDRQAGHLPGWKR